MSNEGTARDLVLDSIVPPILAVMEPAGFSFRRRGFGLVRRQRAVVLEVSPTAPPRGVQAILDRQTLASLRQTRSYLIEGGRTTMYRGR